MDPAESPEQHLHGLLTPSDPLIVAYPFVDHNNFVSKINAPMVTRLCDSGNCQFESGNGGGQTGC